MKYNFEKQNSLGGIEMKKILLTVLVLFISFSVFAQIQEVESNELVKPLSLSAIYQGKITQNSAL